ncbi:MAG: U32 family peptidase [Lachnospiraceae bacterium]|nr:U32 family peptidase [Lachnospiraceae bacterium]
MSKRAEDFGAVGDTGSLDLIELLAPAGDMDCLTAAIDAGCDAVYAGCKKFGARAYAGNFTSEEMMAAIDRMHLYGKKLYLTLNTLIKPEEFKEVYGFLKPLYETGLDGVIVQDLGIVSLLRDEFKGMEIHASTQMSVSSEYGAELMKELGITRIVLSRELSLEEIGSIIRKTGIETECFVHGAMCYSYSGMCLMSSMLGGRSGNRGRCAGPCRQPYSVNKELKDRYLLSMKDMCTIDILDELVKAGIASFKIEGRMKSPAYVYGVTEIYRRNLERIRENPDEPYGPSEEDRRRLIELYSRGGISDGYYHRHNGLSMITMDKGSYKREDTGAYKSEHKRIRLTPMLEVKAGEAIRLTLSYSPERKASESTEVVRESEEIRITVKGNTAERAEKHPMSIEDLKKQLMKTGDTDFCFEDVRIDTDGMSFVRVAEINGLRRRAIEALEERLTDGYKRSL